VLALQVLLRYYYSIETKHTDSENKIMDKNHADRIRMAVRKLVAAETAAAVSLENDNPLYAKYEKEAEIAMSFLDSLITKATKIEEC
jgi:hypothetical protein